MAVHTATIEWVRNDSKFTDNQYSRVHTWRFDGGLAVPASSSPHVVRVPLSNPANVDPEEGFVAAPVELSHAVVSQSRGFEGVRYRQLYRSRAGVHGEERVREGVGVTRGVTPAHCFPPARRSRMTRMWRDSIMRHMPNATWRTRLRRPVETAGSWQFLDGAEAR